MSLLRRLLGIEESIAIADLQIIRLGRVTADGSRCIQCGVCGYNCPVGIDVRSAARQGVPVTDARCISCGQCIQVCPRGTLRWEEQVVDEQ